MPVLQPKVTEDATQDSWAFDVTNQINLNEESLLALLVALQDLPDGSTVDELRDAIISALSTR